MKNRLSFLALGFAGIFALLPGCGDDEGTGDGGSAGGGDGDECRVDDDCSGGRLCIGLRGNGDDYCDEGETCICVGGGEGGTGGTTGGTSGSSGKGGSSGATLGGSGGKGGTGGTPAATTLGEPCASDADCEGLTCLLPDGLPSGDGPPNGLCTQVCTSDDQCLELANVAYCVIFEGDPAMNPTQYCIPGCTGGQVGAPKCATRDDFACNILTTIPTTQACVDINGCGVNQVCFEDVCQDMVTACTPVCRADSDCADEQFCDFSSGFCTGTEPTGLPIGSLCDPSLPAAQDECNGFCSPTDATETEGTCAAFCSAGLNGYGCGWVGDGAPDAGCLYATIISRDAAGAISLAESDLMICGGLCDCNDDCPAEVEFCMDENAGDPMFSIDALFGRPGYCRPLIATNNETEADSIACAQASK